MAGVDLLPPGGNHYESSMRKRGVGRVTDTNQDQIRQIDRTRSEENTEKQNLRAY